MRNQNSRHNKMSHQNSQHLFLTDFDFNPNNENTRIICDEKSTEEFVSDLDMNVFLLKSVDAKEYYKHRDGERKDLLKLLINTKFDKSSLSTSDQDDINEAMNGLLEVLNDQQDFISKIFISERRLPLYIKAVTCSAELINSLKYLVRKFTRDQQSNKSEQDVTSTDERVSLSSTSDENEADESQMKKFTVYYKNSAKSPNDIACVISTTEQKVSCAEDIICETILDVNEFVPIPQEYDLIRNLTKISVADSVKLKKTTRPWKIVLSHYMRRDTTKEVIAIYLDDHSKWREVPITESRNEFGGIKAFNVQADIKAHFPLLLTLVWRPKTETFQVDKKGIRFYSSLLSGISFNAAQRAIKIKMTYSLKIRQIEAWYVEELKKRHPVEMKGLLSASPIVDISASIMKKTNKQLQLVLPIAEQTQLVLDNKTEVESKVEEELYLNESDDELKSRERTKTGFVPLDGFQKLFQPRPFMIGYANDDVFLLVPGDENKWKVWSVDSFQRETNELVSLEFEDTNPYKLVVLRTAIGTTADEAIKMMQIIEQDFCFYSVTILLRYNPSESDQKCVLEACLISNLGATIEQLEELGYTRGSRSQTLVMKDREMIYFYSRGNIRIIDGKDQNCFSFNYLLRNRVFFTIKEEDRFTQKNLEDYRGYFVLLRNQTVRKRKPNTKQIEYEYITEKVNLCQLAIWKQKPKPPPKEHRLRVTDFHFSCPSESFNTNILRLLAKRSSTHWIKLAKKLGVSETRTQTLRRLYVGKDNEELCYQMLSNWVQSKNCAYKKVPDLAQALEDIEKFDVVRELSIHCKTK